MPVSIRRPTSRVLRQEVLQRYAARFAVPLANHNIQLAMNAAAQATKLTAANGADIMICLEGAQKSAHIASNAVKKMMGSGRGMAGPIDKEALLTLSKQMQLARQSWSSGRQRLMGLMAVDPTSPLYRFETHSYTPDSLDPSALTRVFYSQLHTLQRELGQLITGKRMEQMVNANDPDCPIAHEIWDNCRPRLILTRTFFIHAEVGPILLTGEGRTIYKNCGPYIIGVTMSNGDQLEFILLPWRDRCHWTGGSSSSRPAIHAWHPHVRMDGSVCLGTGEYSIFGLLSQGEISSAVHAFTDLMSENNDLSPFHRLREFKAIEQKGSCLYCNDHRTRRVMPCVVCENLCCRNHHGLFKMDPNLSPDTNRGWCYECKGPACNACKEAPELAQHPHGRVRTDADMPAPPVDPHGRPPVAGEEIPDPPPHARTRGRLHEQLTPEQMDVLRPRQTALDVESDDPDDLAIPRIRTGVPWQRVTTEDIQGLPTDVGGTVTYTANSPPGAIGTNVEPTVTGLPANNDDNDATPSAF